MKRCEKAQRRPIADQGMRPARVVEQFGIGKRFQGEGTAIARATRCAVSGQRQLAEEPSTTGFT